MVFQTYALAVVVILVATETQFKIKPQLLSWIRPILVQKELLYKQIIQCPIIVLSPPPNKI